MNDRFDAPAVRRYLPPDFSAHAAHIEIYDTLPSTNTCAKTAAANGAPHGTVIAARTQTAGRGRRGRSFLSPEGTGLYVSLILRPALSPEEAATALTTAAAVALCRALSSLGVADTAIKWVNDVWRGERKIAGILTEASCDAAAKLEYAILGVGVNLLPPPGGFPPELAEIAGAAFPAPIEDGRARLLAAFLTEFFALYSALSHDPAAHLAEYRRRCLILGRRVTVLPTGGEAYTAVARAIDERFRLIVDTPAGARALDSGEVSLKI